MKKFITALLIVVFSSMWVQSADELVFKNINFQRESYGESIKIILKEIAKANGTQIKIDENVEDKKETFSFNMPLQGAFKMIIDGNGLSYRMQDGVLIVSGSKVTQKILVLQYLKAQRLKAILNKYKIFDSKVDLTYGDGALDNTVHIKGDSEAISELEGLISQLEKAEQLKLELAKQKVEQELKEEEKKRQAIKDEKELELKKLQEGRQKRKLELAQQRAEIDRKTQEQSLEQNDIIFNNKLNELSRNMIIDIVPLKYINVSKSEMEFQGEKIQVESLEDTLKGLLGSSFVDGNYSKEFGLSSRDRAYVKIDQRTNSVIIKDFPEKIDEIKKILVKLDKRPQLIEIEVTIAMGNSGFTEELGIKLGGTKKYPNNRTYGLSTGDSVSDNLNNMRQTATTQTSTTSNGAVSSSETQALNTSFQSTPLLQPIGALGLSSSMLFMGAKNMLNIQLNAMENEGVGKVLSNPRIITLNNREATILSGDSVSIPTATADKMSLETVDTGISIKAKPHIVLAEGEDPANSDILLDIAIEKSSLGAVSRERIETSESKVNSNVIIKNGQTLILGGLFQYTKSDADGGVPFLKDIPLIGLFFKTKSNTLHKNELIFFITPKIVTLGAINEMQNNDYMSYKNSLEHHKKALNKKVNDIDKIGTQKLKKFKRKEIDHLKILSGEEDVF